MDLRSLRAFVEVVRQGGFSAAARVVNATQPTISKAVRQLEDEVGAPLLGRPGHRVALTTTGEVVYRRAVAMLAEREHMLAELAALKGLEEGKLRLGLPPLGSSILFAPLVAEFRSRHPGIEIELLEHGSARLEAAVLAGEIELAVSLLPVSDVFDWQAVCDEPLVALLPPGHRLGGRPTVRLTDLADSPIILFDSGFALNGMIEAACRRRGFIPREAARSGQADFIIALVAAGLGVALLPRLNAEQRVHSPIQAALLDEQDLRWRAALVWRRGAILSPPARAWLALAEEHAPVA
ncbi:LysR substrate-binding domain-containing protein [Telmatospirillum sp.]|uniref:LysR family transcriptional regulator n=1 Tax=Telmatospirillum sp. TaxID=2079197 RepID=UPI0028438F8B|nr:LysR substrate-binding domain-containing protein [Telmatospirillum sp.]MDR3440224.1 LysR substrate-binding domain-containing protein [Telmatospirillum sp.]